jgi:hypothetical protein
MPPSTMPRAPRATIVCPACGSDSIKAWHMEPVAYRGHFELDDDGELDFQFEEAGEIGEGGALDEYVCASCCSILQDEGQGRLVAVGRY